MRASDVAVIGIALFAILAIFGMGVGYDIYMDRSKELVIVPLTNREVVEDLAQKVTDLTELVAEEMRQSERLRLSLLASMEVVTEANERLTAVETDQCYLGQLQITTPFQASFYAGGAMPNMHPVLWAGWVPLCGDRFRWGDSLGPLEEYGGKTYEEIRELYLDQLREEAKGREGYDESRGGYFGGVPAVPVRR